MVHIIMMATDANPDDPVEEMVEEFLHTKGIKVLWDYEGDED